MQKTKLNGAQTDTKGAWEARDKQTGAHDKQTGAQDKQTEAQRCIMTPSRPRPDGQETLMFSGETVTLVTTRYVGCDRRRVLEDLEEISDF